MFFVNTFVNYWMGQNVSEEHFHSGVCRYKDMSYEICPLLFIYFDIYSGSNAGVLFLKNKHTHSAVVCHDSLLPVLEAGKEQLGGGALPSCIKMTTNSRYHQISTVRKLWLWSHKVCVSYLLFYNIIVWDNTVNKKHKDSSIGFGLLLADKPNVWKEWVFIVFNLLLQFFVACF